MRKRSLIFKTIFLISIVILIISVFECDETNEGNEKEQLEIGKVYTPQNDYLVIVCIEARYREESGNYRGDLWISIYDTDSNFVEDALVEINSVVIPYIEDSYEDTSNGLNFNPGTEYFLTITIGTEIIAEGLAIVPISPNITYPSSGYTHTVNQQLNVEYDDIQNTTSASIEIYCDCSGYPEYNDCQYVDEINSFPSGTYTIPSNYFIQPCEYCAIDIFPISGLESGFVMGEMGIESLVEGEMELNAGYNIRGPKGAFFVTSEGINSSVSISVEN